tara:strand:- start:1882 stop:2175 length:294 start_codon:yes stop_codon:yes gene_type:complete
MNSTEHLKYQLETLASYEPSDLDYPEFDVAYEDENGFEGFHTVCCTEIAKRAVERIYKLESILAQVKPYLVAAESGSMSRNNSEALAGELLELTEKL